MNPLLPRAENRLPAAKIKAKSAKYKGIERISRKIFYCIIMIILILFIFVLSISVIIGEKVLIEESIITLLEASIVLLFGVTSVFSRYKSRLLAYIMMSLSYTFSLLAKFVLEDLCKVLSKECSNWPTEIRIFNLAIVCCFIVQTVLAYLIRDALIMADNYIAGTSYHLLETLHDIQLEIIKEGISSNEGLLGLDRVSLCDLCKGKAKNDSHYVCFEDNLCLRCRNDVSALKDIELKEDWFDSKYLRSNKSFINQ